MKIIILALFTFGFLITLNAQTQNPPPANYPLVRGIIKKIKLTEKTITLKHQRIPNLNMPGMTMPFNIEPALIGDLKIDDKVNFVADDVDGEATVLWIQKSTEAGDMILCKGKAPTIPITNIEIDLRKNKFSTIRYEFISGSLKGTAYVQSIGLMHKINVDGYDTYISENAELILKEKRGLIRNASFSHYSSGTYNSATVCSFE
ncbi:MAG: copper-binding protein [Oligoflexia bacterium]|nr:copper-binding protein [Oligoflexia bacterium]